MAAGIKIIPAENILRAAIWEAFNSSLLCFIRMNELPQIMVNSKKMPQLTSLFNIIFKNQPQMS
jgi:hypothetical protein